MYTRFLSKLIYMAEALLCLYCSLSLGPDFLRCISNHLTSSRGPVEIFHGLTYTNPV